MNNVAYSSLLFAIIISYYTHSYMFGTCGRKYSRNLQTRKVLYGGVYTFSNHEPKGDAYNIALQSSQNSSMPCIILVNPFLSENVGAVGRAMLNFGLTELRIVDPQPLCDIHSEGAKSLAVGAADILKNAKIYSTLEDSIADLHRVVATSVRVRSMTQMMYTPSTAAKVIVSNMKNNLKTGILFGRERSGLTTEEIAVADSIVSISTFKHFASLNLAQAVNIICYELWNKRLEEDDLAPPPSKLLPVDYDRVAKREDSNYFLERLQEKLDERGYQTDEIKRLATKRNIASIFNRIPITSGEIAVLHGLITCLTTPKNKAD